MSIGLYDQAFFDKVKSVFDNSYYCQVDRAIAENSEANSGQARFPMVSIWRVDNPLDLEEAYNHASHRRGRMASKVDQLGSSRERSLPVRINYQLDVWATKRSIVDDLTRELIFFLIDNPNITINVDHGDSVGELPYEFSLKIDEGPIDNTEFNSFEDKGYLYRCTLDLHVVDAKYFMISTGKLVVPGGAKIDYDFY